MESYIQQGSVHVQGDTKVEWKDYEKGKRLALADTRCMSKIFQIGQDHGEKEMSRIKNALHEDSSIVPNLIITQKDHKPIDPNTGLPKTRPVCEASSTHNQRLSDMLSDILAATFDSEDIIEAISMEDMLSKIEGLNKRIQEGEISPRNLIVGSLDVESLYPSVDTREAARICRDRVLNSPLSIEGIDYKWAGIYLATSITPSEEDCSKWWFPKLPSKLSSQEKKLLTGCLVQQMVKTVFNMYLYTLKAFLHLFLS